MLQAGGGGLGGRRVGGGVPFPLFFLCCFLCVFFGKLYYFDVFVCVCFLVLVLFVCLCFFENCFFGMQCAGGFCALARCFWLL